MIKIIYLKCNLIKLFEISLNIQNIKTLWSLVSIFSLCNNSSTILTLSFSTARPNGVLFKIKK